MQDIICKIRKYEHGILTLDASGGALHIVICDDNVDDSSIEFCISLVNNMENPSMLDIMCKNCAELLLKIPEEKREEVIADCSDDGYIYSVGDTVFSQEFNSIGTIVKTSKNSNEDIYVKLKITEETEDVETANFFMSTIGSVPVYEYQTHLVESI